MAHGAIWTRRTGYSLMAQRNGVHYYRKVVPEPRQAIIGKREILISLKTKDREQAKRKLHQVAAETGRLLDAAWRKHALLAATPELLAERWKEQLLREDEQERSLLRPKTKEEFDQEVADLEGALTEGTSYLTFGNISGLQDSFLSVLEQHGMKLSPESPEFREFAHVFLRVSVDVIQILRKRAIGDWSDTPSWAIPVEPMPTLAELEDNPPLSVVLEKWRAERKPPSQTWHEWSTVFRRFREVAGEDLPVKAITKGHVRTFKDALMRAPRRTPERLRGRPFPEILDATKDDKTLALPDHPWLPGGRSRHWRGCDSPRARAAARPRVDGLGAAGDGRLGSHAPHQSRSADAQCPHAGDLGPCLRGLGAAGQKCGSDAFFAKPCMPATVLTKIDEMLGLSR
jgi:F0F1-type ATP synthase membrane subunit b/b'